MALGWGQDKLTCRSWFMVGDESKDFVLIALTHFVDELIIPPNIELPVCKNLKVYIFKRINIDYSLLKMWYILLICSARENYL